MASLMEELIDTLDAEEVLYGKLIPVEEEKTRAIISNDLEALQDIATREHELVDRTTALEGKREQVAMDIATVLGKDPKTITLEQIVEVLKNQPEDQKKLDPVSQFVLLPSEFPLSYNPVIFTSPPTLTNLQNFISFRTVMETSPIQILVPGCTVSLTVTFAPAFPFNWL